MSVKQVVRTEHMCYQLALAFNLVTLDDYKVEFVKGNSQTLTGTGYVFTKYDFDMSDVAHFKIDLDGSLHADGCTFSTRELQVLPVLSSLIKNNTEYMET